jgi:hypothetical protein
LIPEEFRDAESLVSTLIDHSIDARECPGIDDLQPDATTSRDVEPWGVFEDRDFLGFTLSLFHFLSKTEWPHVCPNSLDIGQTFQGIEGNWEYLRSL